ncbi:hypothetical protein AX16_003919 [Volvariella volvacea WC 439]|nr:hypothetical protein AX16_003919 [Volvariella volvacea WC 439]
MTARFALFPHTAPSRTFRLMTSNLVLNCITTAQTELNNIFQVKVPYEATVDELRDEIWKKMTSWHYSMDVYQLALHDSGGIPITSKEEFRIGFAWATLELDPTRHISHYETLRLACPREVHVVVHAPWYLKSDN